MIGFKIRSKINNFVVVEHINDPIANIFNYSVKYNVISVNIYDIFYRRKNKRKLIINSLNCACLWLSILITSLCLLTDDVLNYFENPMIPFDQIKQIFLLITSIYILVTVFKTDYLLEEKRNNLIRLKVFYHLILNDKSEHKLNAYNFKRYKNFVKSIDLILIRCGHPFMLLFILTLTFVFLKSNLTIVIICLPLIIYSIFTYVTSSLSIAALNLCLFVYQYMRLKQINNRMKIFSKINKISPGIFIRLINEHNDISSEIDKLNLVFRKSYGVYNFLVCCILVFLLYLSIYTKSIYYRLVFVICFAIFLSVFLVTGFLMEKLTNTAHQSYNLIYSLSKRRLTYKIRFKVT